MGLAMVEEYLNYESHVVATVRNAQWTKPHYLQETAAERLEIEHVDITIPEQIGDLCNRLASRSFDLLFVNSRVTNSADETIADISTEESSLHF